MKFSEKVSNFFRAYQVKLPAAKAGKHHSTFIEQQLVHIDRLLLETQKDDEVHTALGDLRREWAGLLEKVAGQRQPTKLQSGSTKEPAKPWLNVHRFAQELNLGNPNGNYAVDEEDANREIAKIDEAIITLWSETCAQYSDESKQDVERKLRGWIRGYMMQHRRLGFETGTLAKPSKGPSAKQLQKRAEKRQKDSDRRTKMRGRG